jgi:two-component system cell cycle response regulator DivK
MKNSPLILVVDDFLDNREMYALYLVHAGFRVAEAGNGLDALGQALTLQPDLIVMDLSLPGLDGWEATRRLKADTRTHHIPVVALTSHALEGFSEGARAAGCDGFITKPCLPEHLAKEIWTILDGTQRARPERRPLGDA